MGHLAFVASGACWGGNDSFTHYCLHPTYLHPPCTLCNCVSSHKWSVGTAGRVSSSIQNMGHMHAGQAIVQFARSAADGCQRTYALKFFLKQKDFESEKAFYRNSPIGKLLPMLAGLVEDGELKDLDDHALPPCIIMERGESLNEWCKRRKPDIWGVMPVRHALLVSCWKLEKLPVYYLHDTSGFVHRLLGERL